MIIGINLYGVLKDRKDAMAALRELRELGYSAVEPCVAPGVLEGWERAQQRRFEPGYIQGGKRYWE